MTKSQGIFIAFGILFFLFIGCTVYFNGNYNLNKIKSKTVGDGQYGTARFATDKEVHQSLKYIEFDSVNWRKGIDLPKSQGLVVGSKINFGKTFGYVDCDDIHLLMIGAAGFRVIIVTVANSLGNIRVFELLPKLKTKKYGWCIA